MVVQNESEEGGDAIYNGKPIDFTITLNTDNRSDTVTGNANPAYSTIVSTNTAGAAVNNEGSDIVLSVEGIFF